MNDVLGVYSVMLIFKTTYGDWVINRFITIMLVVHRYRIFIKMQKTFCHLNTKR